MLSFEHYEMSSLPPPTPALQRILSGDRQSIMTEVSQIDATGSAVLGNLLYSDQGRAKSCRRRREKGRDRSQAGCLKDIYYYTYEENLQA